MEPLVLHFGASTSSQVGPQPGTATTRALWCGPAGDVLVIVPPYIVEREHIDKLVNTLADSTRGHV